MGMASPGGLSSGRVVGTVEMDISQLIAAANHAKQLGLAFERALNGVNAPAQRAQNSINSLGQDMLRLAGIAGGVAFARQFAQFAIQADATATAYRRQSTAAVELAGSQGKLNDLLDEYGKVTGNQIDKATALADVTKLQAIGFADTTDELNEFVSSARGASLALGKSQEYIIGQLQLAIANQSKMRLDQIGLGVEEVEKRIKALRAANGQLTAQQAYQNAVLGLLKEKFGALTNSLEAQATGAEKASKAWKELKLEFGESLAPAVGGIMEYVSQLVNEARQSISGIAADLRYINSLMPNLGISLPQSSREAPRYRTLEEGVLSNQINSRQSQADYLRSNITGLRSTGGNATEIARQEAQLKAVNQELGQFSARLALVSGAVSRTAGANSFAQGFAQFGQRPSAAGPSYTDTQTDAIRQWSTSVQAIEREAAASRLSATKSYEQQRAEALSDYGRTVVREEQDFGRNRLRAVQDFAKQMADAQADAAEQEADAARDYARAVANVREEAGKRETKWQSDYNEKITELRSDSNERLVELEANYAKARERAELDHRDRLLSAAARLDAVGVFEEQRNFARQQADAQGNYDEQRDKLAKALKEQLDDALKSQQERLEEARAGDAERLADMRAAFEEQRAEARKDAAERLADMQEDFDERLKQEDEDRALANARRAEDHAAQMAQMAQAQAERMAQIDQQVASEKKALEEKFLADMEAEGIHNQQWLKIQAERQRQSLLLFEKFWDEINKKFAPQGPKTEAEAGGGVAFPSHFADGGWVQRGGMARVHAGEYVVPAAQARAMAGGMARNVTIGDINVYGAVGQSEQALAAAVRRELMAALEEAA